MGYLLLVFLTLPILRASSQGISVVGNTSEVIEGNTVPVTCLIDNPNGRTIRDVVWERQGVTIFTYDAVYGFQTPSGTLRSRQTNYSHTSTFTTLYIGNGTRNDDGPYQCKVNPVSGSFSSGVATVIISENASEAVIDLSPPVMNNIIREKAGATINIRVSAPCTRPGIKIRWSKFNEQVPAVNCSSDGRSQLCYAILQIDRLTPSHSGSLQIYGSHPSFLDTSGNRVDKIMRQLNIIVDPAACDSTPCQNNGSCGETTSSYKCTCKPNYYGINCQIFCRPQVSQDARIAVCVVFAIVFLSGGGVFAYFLFMVIKSKDEDKQEKGKCLYIGVGAGVTVAVIAIIIIIVMATRKTRCP